jgi:hypothetical protein
MCKSGKKKLKFNNSGMTLVELIATFALLALFMVVASNIIFRIMGMYYQARGTSYGMQVSDVIASKVVSMLEGAQDVGSLQDTDDYTNVTMTAENTAVLIKHGTGGDNAELDSVELVDASGSRVCIKTVEEDGKNYLSIHYYPVPAGEKKYDGEQDRYYYEQQLYKAVEWGFDKKAYLDYNIKSLAFEKPEGFPGNVIRLTLTVDSDRYGEYTTVRYIECYNFDEADYGRIR